MKSRNCPLCGGPQLLESWLKVTFDGRVFDYLECDTCRSLICSPMPIDEVVARMYDASYLDSSETGEDTSVKKFDEVIKYLKTLAVGKFVDFGCGDGRLLRAVKNLGWEVLGIDFNPEFAAPLRSEGINVVGTDETLGETADVLHVGDVLEHLTDLDTQFAKILSLVKKGGIVVAHGPLEANQNLFYRTIRALKGFRRGVPKAMPPYHVILATSLGQRTLFTRNGLEEERFKVTEIAFPAAETAAASDLLRPRRIALYLLRKLSQRRSRRDIANLGNRYLYIGRKTY